MDNVTIDPIEDVLAREFGTDFSSTVLGLEYADLKKIVYPHPAYRSFLISKRNGNPRLIEEPRKKVKALQRKILAYLQVRSTPSRKCVHGFVNERSIVTNAASHSSVRTKQILNVDLKDFFPSITFKRVRGALRKQPFYLSHAVASLVAHICTRNGYLPQGAPTSPFLSNIICRGLDRDLSDLARRHRAVYTRYADDLTFSFDRAHEDKLPNALCSIGNTGVEVGEELLEIIIKHGFTPNPEKTRLSNRFSRMEVTGLTVNEFPNVRREFVNRIRGALHAWDVYGYEAAETKWLEKIATTSELPISDRAWSRQTRINVPPRLKNVIWGRLLYLRMVRGKDDLLYTRLAEKYNYLCDCERLIKSFSAPSLPIEPVAQDIASAEDAVFFVKWDGKTKDGQPVGGEGTAFAYRELNLLVTCEHLLSSSVEYSGHSFNIDYMSEDLVEKSLTVVRPRTKEEFSARLIHRSTQHDVALLAFDVSELPQHRFFAAHTGKVKIGMAGTLIGFPSYRKWTRPDFLGEKVLNFFEPNKWQRFITITGAGSIRPGNSGGPYVDDQYKVVGVAQRGAYNGHGHDTCLAVSVLEEWINAWKEQGSKEIEPRERRKKQEENEPPSHNNISSSPQYEDVTTNCGSLNNTNKISYLLSSIKKFIKEARKRLGKYYK